MIKKVLLKQIKKCVSQTTVISLSSAYQEDKKEKRNNDDKVLQETCFKKASNFRWWNFMHILYGMYINYHINYMVLYFITIKLIVFVPYSYNSLKKYLPETTAWLIHSYVKGFVNRDPMYDYRIVYNYLIHNKSINIKLCFIATIVQQLLLTETLI